MNFKLIACAILLAFTISKAQGQEIEDDLYAELLTEFEFRNTNLEITITRFEEVLIDFKILTDKSWKSKIEYLQLVSKTDSFLSINFLDSLNADLRFKLSLQPVSEITNSLRKTDPVQFELSKFNAILRQIESNQLNDRARPSIIANAFLDNLSTTDFEHSFYRALFFLAVANMSDLNYRTLDFMLVEEADYERYFEPNAKLPLVQYRNIINITVNNQGSIGLRGQKLDSSRDLSEHLKSYYTINRKLSKEEAIIEISNREYDGYDFPFYSNTSIPEIEEKIVEARHDYIEALNQKKETKSKGYNLAAWQLKKKLLLLYGKERLPEIDRETYIEINTGGMKTILRLLEQEIRQAFFELRDSESTVLYGESYHEIFLRHNFLLNDFTKLHLLEDLFPIRIFVNPTNIFEDAPPPPVMEIIENAPPPVMENVEND